VSPRGWGPLCLLYTHHLEGAGVGAVAVVLQALERRRTLHRHLERVAASSLQQSTHPPRDAGRGRDRGGIIVDAMQPLRKLGS
jgi:hypothetical protein